MKVDKEVACHIVVATAARLLAGDRGFMFRFPVRAGDIVLLHSMHTGWGGHSVSYSVIASGFLLGV